MICPHGVVEEVLEGYVCEKCVADAEDSLFNELEKDRRGLVENPDMVEEEKFEDVIPSQEVEIVSPAPVEKLPEDDHARYLMKTATTLANTEFVPKAMKGSPYSVFATLMYAEELGIGFIQALRHVSVIEGKPSASAEFIRGMIVREGHRISITKYTNEGVTMVGTRGDNGETLEVSWGKAEAQTAGLLNKQTYKSYPRDLYLARCTTSLARALFSDVINGLSYTPEELS